MAAFSPSRSVSRLPMNVSPGVMFTGRCLSGLGAGSGNAGGEPFAVVQVQRRFAPEASAIHWHWRHHWMPRGTALMNHSYPDGGRRSGMSARSQALFPSAQSNRPHGGRWRRRKNAPSGKHAGGISVCGGVFPLSDGSRRISLSDLRFFMPSLTAKNCTATVFSGCMPSMC